MKHSAIFLNTVKIVIVIVATFGVFLMMRRIAGDVGGMPAVFREAYAQSIFIETGTFIPAIVTLMSLILLHLLVNFALLHKHMRLPLQIRGVAYGFLFGMLWFIGFMELVVIYDSSFERHAQSGVRDLVTLTCFGLIAGLFFTKKEGSSSGKGLFSDAGLAGSTVAIAFSIFHWAQYPLTLEPVEQSVDDIPSVLWLLLAGFWIGVMYAFLRNMNMTPMPRVAFFAINTFGINWLFYTAFYVLFLNIPIADIVLRSCFDVVGVIAGLIAFERLRSHSAIVQDRRVP